MGKKRKTLIDNFQEIIDSGNLEDFKAVFDKCEITATNRGSTTRNAFSYKGLKPAHIQFLIDNGLDANSDCGYGHSAVSHQAKDLDNLKCLLDNGADINLAIKSYRGSALSGAAENLDPIAVSNLLECGASVDVLWDFDGKSILDAALAHCDNGYIIKALEICKMLLAAGAKTTDQTEGYVKKIGERFEFYRSNFNKNFVDEYSKALDDLYVLFNVEPVPRRVVYDGKSKIVVKSTTWQKQHNELWNMLVPGSGAAETVQGEMIRIIGKVLYELLDNGAINWDDEYRKMIAALVTYFQMADGMDAELVEEACNIAKHISKSSDEKTLYRLNELVVLWVIANPDPIVLESVDYIR